MQLLCKSSVCLKFCCVYRNSYKLSNQHHWHGNQVSGKQNGADGQFLTGETRNDLALLNLILEKACSSAAAVTECYISDSEWTLIYFYWVELGINLQFFYWFFYQIMNKRRLLNHRWSKVLTVCTKQDLPIKRYWGCVK